MIYSINEGQQAEEYKARKAKEKEDADKMTDRENKYYHHHTPKIGMQHRGDKDGDNGRYEKARKMAIDERNKRKLDAETQDKKAEDYYKMHGHYPENYDNTADKAYDHLRRAKVGPAADAINRHMRRHPKQYKEGTIFESVEFI